MIDDLLRKTHISDKASQKRHEPGLLRPEARAIWEKEPAIRSSQMARTTTQPQQGGSTNPSPQQQGQQAGGSTQQAGQPIFRDWASI
ncbi:hypothetical protein G8O29_10685 [Rhodobacter sp. M37P]|uniref:Uncharacterized protein n=1 Tax=Rhodobacter calidifons TaxID=2715277 RepID=A0ABX0G8K6_9RHOB|nr:hypothetical protein [Rhodobacter calidifons]